MKSYLKLHVAVILAGFTGIFGKLITLNEGLISWYRLILSGVTMLIFFMIKGSFPKIDRKEKYKIGCSGMLLGLHWVFFYGSIKYSNISVGVVCFALTSFFNAILAPLINNKRISLQEIFLSSITLCGIGLIFGLDAGYRTGIILGTISSVFSALYTISSERTAQRHKSTTIILYQMLGGSLGLTLAVPFFLMIYPVNSVLPSLSDFGWLLILAVFCTVVMYFLITDALSKIPSFTVSLTFNLEPIYTICLAILIYKEGRELSMGFFIGLALIICSLLFQMYFLSNTKRMEARVLSE